MDPRQVAAKDKRQYVVEAILRYERPTKGKARSNYKFLIKWLGWPEEEATWEPYDNVKNNAILHKFLRENNMDEMIPRHLQAVRTAPDGGVWELWNLGWKAGHRPDGE
eukprot:gene11746-13197_t